MTRLSPNKPFVAEQESEVDSPPVEQEEDLYTDISLGTLVELTWDAKKLYGTVRWIGNLPGIRETMAGLELVKYIHLFIYLLLEITIIITTTSENS